MGCRCLCDEVFRSKRAQAENPGGSQKEGKAHKTIIQSSAGRAGLCFRGPIADDYIEKQENFLGSEPRERILSSLQNRRNERSFIGDFRARGQLI